MKKITPAEIKRAKHPNEDSRFALAIIVCVPVIICGLVLTFVSYGAILLFILFLMFSVWFIMKLIETNMIANSIRVSEINFPEINSICGEIKECMGYNKTIPIFIIEEGGYNAFLGKFFKRKFIQLTSSLAEDMAKKENIIQLKWIIARFIGSLQTKRVRLDFIRTLIESIDDIKIFSLFILPYERASQYTGDNLGLLYCEDVEQVMVAFNKFLVGSKLYDKILFEGVVIQSNELKGTLFSLLARLGSTHPHLVYRYLNLLAFAKKIQPEQFEKYISKYDQQTRLNIGSALRENY